MARNLPEGDRNLKVLDVAWRGTSVRTVVTLYLESRDEVDAVWQRVTAAGYASAQIPFDAFWGSRFAVVCDHDGNQFGLMSPRSDEHRSWPPVPAPT